MIGVINVCKPKNVTSSNVVVKVKKLLGIKRVGHMGTLDPLASGVIPICVGKATRLFDYFLKKQKTYIATFSFGFQTTTLDLEGEVEEKSANIPTKEQVESALKTFVGKISQLPPQFSSKKVGGQKSCDMARKGIQVKLKECPVEIFEYELLRQIDNATFEFKITCSAGTYIRSLARDLGKKLNSCATMVNLIRIAAGNFKIENSLKYEDFSAESLKSNLLPLEKVLKDFKKVEVCQNEYKDLLSGKEIFGTLEKDFNGDCAVLFGKKVVAISSAKGGNLKLKTFLAEE